MQIENDSKFRLCIYFTPFSSIKIAKFQAIHLHTLICHNSVSTSALDYGLAEIAFKWQNCRDNFPTSLSESEVALVRLRVSASEIDVVALVHLTPLFSEIEIALLRSKASSSELDAAFAQVKAQPSAPVNVYSHSAHYCSLSN